MTTRRRMLGGALAALLVPAALAQSRRPSIEVWKSPTCGCCKDWIEHMRLNGFEATVHDTGNTEARTRLGLPVQYGSCHTATIGGYVLEGHVPASEVQRLLKDKPRALGLAVPGMPVGSPGMDGPEYKGRKDAYQVLLISRDGTATPYRSYP